MKKTIAHLIAYFILTVFIFILCRWILEPLVGVRHPLILFISMLIPWYLGICAIEYFFTGIDSKEKLEKVIIKKLTAEVYKCEKDEGEWVYQMNGGKYIVHFWQSREKEFRTDIVYNTIIDKDWDLISVEERSLLANAVSILPETKKYYSQKTFIGLLQAKCLGNAL